MDIQDWLDEHQAPQKIGGTVLYVRSDDVRELFAEQQDELSALSSALSSSCCSAKSSLTSSERT